MKGEWAGETVAVVGSGPSLRQRDVDRLRRRARVIVVNDSWRLCSWADMLYAADHRWWQYHDYVRQFQGQRVTQQSGPKQWPAEAAANGLTVLQSRNNPGFSEDPAVIHTGSNSGFQAVNIALLRGASRILLLGIDLYGTHWFGEHPPALRKNSPHAMFRKAFAEAAAQLDYSSVSVINCSLLSTLECFPKRTVREVFDDEGQHSAAHLVALSSASI